MQTEPSKFLAMPSTTNLNTGNPSTKKYFESHPTMAERLDKFESERRGYFEDMILSWKIKQIQPLYPDRLIDK